MKKFFPADFPTRPKSLKKQTIPALCAVHKAGVRSTGEVIEGYEGYEILECKFALTPEEKAEFFAALEFVDSSQLWPLWLDAVKEAARQAQSVSGSPARSDFGFARDGVEAFSGSSPEELEAPSTVSAKPQTLSDNNQSNTPSQNNDNTGILQPARGNHRSTRGYCC